MSDTMPMKRAPTEANEIVATVMMFSADSGNAIDVIMGQFNFVVTVVKVEVIICVYVVNHLALRSHSKLMTHTLTKMKRLLEIVSVTPV